jgi:AcrR family transcriptional regulator
VNPDSSQGGEGRLRERLREATAEAILAAAEEVFAAEGLAGARMEAIAARAGVAVGTLYNHFEDRQELWRRLVASRRAALLRRLDAALEAARGRPFADALDALLRALFAHWAEHRAFVSLLLQSQPALERAPRGGAVAKPFAREIVRRLARVVRRGVAEGVLRAEGADLYPAALLGMARSLLLLEIGGGPERPAGDPVGRLVDLFLRGAGRRP